MVKELTGRPMRRGCRVAWLPLQLSPPLKKNMRKKMLPRQEEDTKRERWFSNS